MSPVESLKRTVELRGRVSDLQLVEHRHGRRIDAKLALNARALEPGWATDNKGDSHETQPEVRFDPRYQTNPFWANLSLPEVEAGLLGADVKVTVTVEVLP